MKVEIKEEDCISCGLCVNQVPAVFDWNGDEKAEAVKDNVPNNIESETEDVLKNCPTNAIVEV